MPERFDMRSRQRERVTLLCEGTGRTKQSFLDECDVNFIMNKWKRTGELPPGNSRPAHYGDFSEVDGYMQAQNSILEADQAFATLPSWLRNRFQNNPGELLAFLEDPDNQVEAEKLGLTNPPAPEPESTPEPDPEPAPEPTPEEPPGDDS